MNHDEFRSTQVNDMQEKTVLHTKCHELEEGEVTLSELRPVPSFDVRLLQICHTIHQKIVCNFQHGLLIERYSRTYFVVVKFVVQFLFLNLLLTQGGFQGRWDKRLVFRLLRLFSPPTPSSSSSSPHPCRGLSRFSNVAWSGTASQNRRVETQANLLLRTSCLPSAPTH